MNVTFMGYGMLGANVLRGLVRHHRVKLVVTHKTGFSELNEPDVQDAAAELGLPVAFSSTAREPELHRRIGEVDPDVIVSTNWRTKVPPEVLALPRLGAINVHDALLPRYAGFGAVNWAIRNGESVTGLTAHYMDAELDTGPVITQTQVPIGAYDDAGRVLENLVAQYRPITLRALELVEARHRGKPQNGGGTFYHRIGLEDTRIDWNRSSIELYNLVRGQSEPFVNAWTLHNGLRLFVKAATMPSRAYRGTPGYVVTAADGGVAVVCGGHGASDGRGLILLQVQTEDGPPVRAVDYFRRVGDYLR